MQSVKWLAVGVSNSVARTIVHFFPAARGVSAPYPANCSLTVFGLRPDGGSQTIERAMVLEGARLNQPDGVRLEQAFEELVEGTPGFFGLEIEISSVQPRLDLSSSLCIVELWSRANSVRFQPVTVRLGSAAPCPPSPALGLRDVYNSAALLAVNRSLQPWRLELATGGGGRCSLPAAEIPSGAVVELVVEPEGVAAGPELECGWGMVRSWGVYPSACPPGAALYMVYRDLNTKRPVSVCAL